MLLDLLQDHRRHVDRGVGFAADAVRLIGAHRALGRHDTDAGEALAERISLVPPDPGSADRVLLQELVRDGKIVGREPLSAARERHRAALAELPAYALQLSRGYPAIPTVFESGGEED